MRLIKNTLLLLSFAVFSVALAKPEDSTSAVTEGKNIYLKNCAACHGREVEGALAPNIRFAGKSSQTEFKNALFKGQGKDGRMLRPTMPRFNGGFKPTPGKPPTAAQLKNLQLYLASVK